MPIYVPIIMYGLGLFIVVNPRRACAGGLRYLVCVCVCLCVCLCVRHHESCHYAQQSVQPKVPTASAQSGINMAFSLC